MNIKNIKEDILVNPSSEWMIILNTNSYKIDDVGFEALIFDNVIEVKHLSRDAVINVYSLLMVAKKNAELSFDTLYDLKVCYSSGIEKYYGKIINGEMIPAEGGLTSKEISAVRYIHFMRQINCVLNPNPRFLKSTKRMTVSNQLFRSEYGFEALSEASIILVNWISNKPLALDELMLKRMREGARKGGYESAKTRRAQSKVPKLIELEKERQKLIDTGMASRNTAAWLARKYGCTSSHIRELLKRN